MPGNRRGTALLEVLVALAVLAAAGMSAVGVMGAALQEERGHAERERNLAAAERVLGAMSLLQREELDLRIGERTVGEFVVLVERPETTLYRIGIAQRSDPDAEPVELLATVVHRPVLGQ